MSTPFAEKLADGLALHQSGAFEQAERCYLEIIASEPRHPEALKLLSVLALERGELSRAASFVETALTERPAAGEYLHLLGRIKLEQGELVAAVSALTLAVTNGAPQRIEALLDLAVCQARRKAWHDSLTAARSVLAEDADHLVAQRIAGQACLSLGRDAEGLVHFDRVLARDPSQAGVWHASSLMLYRLGDSVAAYQRAVRACELSPDNVEYVYQRRVAAAGAVPDWHFNMLQDSARNAAFAQAISALVKPEHLVLEIGTGSGLLALLAARGSDTARGARQVVTCEENKILAQAATEIVAANGFSERVRVIAKASTELTLGADLPERADLLICEIFSVQVITEGVLPTLEDAKARLLKPEATIIPAAASARGALVASEALSRKVRAGCVHNFDLSKLNDFTPVIQYLQPGEDIQLLSDALDLLAFDLAGSRDFPAQKQVVELTVSSAGLCQGVLQWLCLELTADVRFENRPGSTGTGGSQHWAPVFYPFPEPVALEIGQRVALRVSHNRRGVRVELAGLSPASPASESA